jgi:hypothetical protein
VVKKLDIGLIGDFTLPLAQALVCMLPARHAYAAPSRRFLHIPPDYVVGVPVVLEQKTTILWKCLYVLASLKDSSGLSGAYEANRRGVEENPVHRRNTTVNVDKIRGFH